MPRSNALKDFEVADPTVSVESTTAHDGAWEVAGTVDFEVYGEPEEPHPLEDEVYGNKKNNGVLVTKIKISFGKAKTEADAKKDAARRLKEIAEKLVEKADKILAA